MKSKSRLALFVTLAFTLASAASAQDLGREFHWSGKLAPDQVVEIKSVKGTVRVSTSAWARIPRVKGSIKGRMGNAGSDGSLKIASVNGSVELEMPDDFSANVEFKSVNGGINSDFPISISGLIGRSAHG